MEVHDENIVQQHVHQAAGGDADDAHMGGAVGLDLHLQIIGHREKHGEGGDDTHILLHQVVVLRGGAQEMRHPVQIEQDDDRQDHGGDDDHKQVLVEIVARLLHIPLPQGDGQDGGGAGGQQDAQGEDQRHKGQGQVDRRQGVLSHAPGDEDAVYHGVEGEDPHGDNGRDGELEKLLD